MTKYANNSQKDPIQVRPDEIRAFEMECKMCFKGVVKVVRDRKPPYPVKNKGLYCLLCGQHYWFDLAPEKFPAWEMLQWDQKSRRDAGRKFANGRAKY